MRETCAQVKEVVEQDLLEESFIDYHQELKRHMVFTAHAMHQSNSTLWGALHDDQGRIV